MAYWVEKLVPVKTDLAVIDHIWKKVDQDQFCKRKDAMAHAYNVEETDQALQVTDGRYTWCVQ